MDIQKLLKKYEEELKTIGEFQIAPGSWSPGPIINSPITARENFLRFGRREKPMFMPFDTLKSVLLQVLCYFFCSRAS